MEEKMVKLEKKIDRILYILESDDKTNQKGIVERVDDVEKAVEKVTLDSRARNIAGGILGGILVTVAGFVGWIIKIIMIK